MKNIHVLPTDKPSRFTFIKYYSYYRFRKDEFINNDTHQNQNIYITSDEEIKEGDWIYNEEREPSVIQCIGKGSLRGWRKIILTTDQDLIKDGVQAIDDEFLEWFVKNPTCEEVEVGYGWIRLTETNNEGYWVSIPDNQFEMQQEVPKMIECYFIPSNNTSSATICVNCGKEKFLHTIGSGIKVSKSVIITQEEPKQVCENCKQTISKYGCACGKQKEEPKQEQLEEVECNNCGYLMSLTEDESVYACYNSECTSCYEEYEEEPKQETLEEAACKALGYDYNDWVSLFSKDKSTVIYSEVTNWCKGAKYMAERMYSEEEVLEILEHHTKYLETFIYQYIDKNDMEENKIWFEQFKKK